MSRHPIFDAPSYPWSRTDARALHVALFQTIVDPGRIRHLYQVSGGLQPLTPNYPPDLAWKEVLELLLVAALLKNLCENIAVDARYAAIKRLVLDVLEAKDLLDHPSPRLNDVIFLDRVDLRSRLGDLGSSSNGILLVRGSPGSGKSWSEKFVTELAFSRGAAVAYICAGLVSDVRGAAEVIFAEYDAVDKVPEQLESPEAWYRRVCLALQQFAAQKKQMLWVIVDDLGDYPEGPRMDREIRAFFEQFGLQMISPGFRKWFRLVLIDYPDGPVPTRWKANWLEDRPDESLVNESEVAGYIVHWAAAKNKVIGTDTASLVAREVIANANTPASVQVPRLRRIHDELAKALRNL